MTSLFLIASFITLMVFPCYLLRQVRLSKQTLLQSEQARLQLEQLLELPETEGELSYPNIRVIIEIDNPLELAKREQPITKYISQLAPELIIEKVYQQVASEIEEGLKEKDVNATITIDKR